MKPIYHYFSRGREGMGERLGSLYNLHTHSKIYFAKYLEMCNTDIVYRFWCNTSQLRSLSLKGIICPLDIWKCYSIKRKYRWLEEVTGKSGPSKWELSFILVHNISLNLYIIVTATLLPLTKPEPLRERITHIICSNNQLTWKLTL